MKSLLKMKRLPGILVLGLVALAVGAAGVPAASASTGTDVNGAQVSGLNKKQRKHKRKALKRCNKKRAHSKKATRKKRKRCKRHVRKKYRKIAKRNRHRAPKGATKTVDLFDNYFSPGEVDLKVNDSIVWKWTNVGGYEAHDVSLTRGPGGVNLGGYQSGPPTTNTKTTFKRAFVKPGMYDFVCTVHFGMTMTVKVSK